MRIPSTTLCIALGMALAGCESKTSSLDAVSQVADATERPDNGLHADAELRLDAANPDADPPDAAPDASVDATVPDSGLQCESSLGLPCTDDRDCAGPGAVCGRPALLGSLAPPQGYCSKYCMSDSDCGPCGVCNEDPGGDGIRICLRRCLPGRECEVPGHICQTRLLGIVPTSTSVCYPSSPTAKIGDPCETMSQCGPNTGCYNNIAWYPGGVCVGKNCDVADPNACPSGTACALLRNQSFCQPACNAAGGCDRPGYVCNRGVVCQEPFGQREVGEPCRLDSDCGAPGSDMVCLRDGARPGGYCTKLDCLEIPPCNVYYCISPEFSCPPFSRCLPLTSSTTPARAYCARECTEGVSCYGTTTCDSMLNVCL